MLLSELLARPLAEPLSADRSQGNGSETKSVAAPIHVVSRLLNRVGQAAVSLRPMVEFSGLRRRQGLQHWLSAHWPAPKMI